MNRQKIEQMLECLKSETPTMSLETQQFLEAMRRNLVQLRTGVLCVCPRCISREVVQAISGYCAIRVTLASLGAKHDEKETVFHELGALLPHLALALESGPTPPPEATPHEGN